jgi:hypothetical protein
MKRRGGVGKRRRGDKNERESGRKGEFGDFSKIY